MSPKIFCESVFDCPVYAERADGRDDNFLSVVIKTPNADFVKSFPLQKLAKKPDGAHTYVILTI